MKNKLGILTALILSLAIAGSTFASTETAVPQDTMTAKPAAQSKMTTTKKHSKKRMTKKRTAKKRMAKKPMMSKKTMTPAK